MTAMMREEQQQQQPHQHQQQPRYLRPSASSSAPTKTKAKAIILAFLILVFHSATMTEGSSSPVNTCFSGNLTQPSILFSQCGSPNGCGLFLSTPGNQTHCGNGFNAIIDSSSCYACVHVAASQKCVYLRALPLVVDTCSPIDVLSHLQVYLLHSLLIYLQSNQAINRHSFHPPLLYHLPNHPLVELFPLRKLQVALPSSQLSNHRSCLQSYPAISHL